MAAGPAVRRFDMHLMRQKPAGMVSPTSPKGYPCNSNQFKIEINDSVDRLRVEGHSSDFHKDHLAAWVFPIKTYFN